MAEPPEAATAVPKSPARDAICYVLPYLSTSESSHYAHVPRLLAEVGRYCPVDVIAQHGEGTAAIPHVRSVYVQRPGGHLRRAWELARVALRLQDEGCNKFFVRISASAALVLGVLGRVCGFTVYYWVSGQGRNLKSRWRDGWVRRLRLEIGDRLFWINTRLVHRLVTGPETMVEYYAREYGVSRNKIRLLYNDVSLNPDEGSKGGLLAKTRLGIAGDKPVVLFVGRVSPLKGGNNLIPLATRLKKLFPDACLLVVGSCDPLPHLPADAQRLQLGNLRFCGPVPNSEIGGYYQAADVFILPSESEGFPRVLAEAMACGVPVVAFDVGGVRDIVHPGQLPFVVPRGDLDGMAEKVARLLGSESLGRKQSQSGRKAVQRFSTPCVAQMFLTAVVRDPS